jgi:hypothetical protein
MKDVESGAFVFMCGIINVRVIIRMALLLQVFESVVNNFQSFFFFFCVVEIIGQIIRNIIHYYDWWLYEMNPNS